jgi:hypothetical protein
MPCSSGLSQLSSMLEPASALSVASDCSICRCCLQSAGIPHRDCDARSKPGAMRLEPPPYKCQCRYRRRGYDGAARDEARWRLSCVHR